MAMKISKVEVWAGEIHDQPGGLAAVLGALADAGVSLDCVIARRQADKPGTGVVFLTPVKNRKAQVAARSTSLGAAKTVPTLRVEGADKPGLGRRMMQAVAETGVNVRGVSAVRLGGKFVAYLGFDNSADAALAAKALKSLGRKK
jgi:hypothetical protein